MAKDIFIIHHYNPTKRTFKVIGDFESDRIKGEFGIYRQRAGDNHMNMF